MPNANQEARAWLAAQRARDAAKAAPPRQPSPQEAADTAAITSPVGLPGPVETLKEFIEPGNVIRGIGEAAGGPVGGLASQPIATGAQMAYEAFTGQPGQDGYGTRLAKDAVFNEAANRVVGPLVGKVATVIGQSAPVQSVRRGIAKRLLGRITPDAREALDISHGIIGDLEAAVNRVRQSNGQPLYSRDQVEQRVAEVLPQLRDKGMFTVGDLTTGTPTDVIEGVSEGSLRGRGRFGAKRQSADVAMEEWPKVYAAMLGDPAQGPDQLAAMAAQEVNRNVRKAVARAGRKVGNVEKIVGKKTVEIDESLLDGIADEISLYAKRTSDVGTGGKLNLDPERIDQPLQAAIELVQRAMGRTFDAETGKFVKRGQPVDMSAYAGYGDAAREVIRGALENQPGVEAKTVDFTFRDIRKLRGYLGQMEAKIPEAERRSAAASLTTLSDALKQRMLKVLDAEDALAGNTGQRSLRFQWEAGNSAYREASALREGFQAKGWIKALEESGSGARVVKDIWPDDADLGRITNLKSLLGGDDSPYWKSMRRFKVEDMLRTHGSNPKYLLDTLTSPTKHSAGYWEEVLGKDDYKRLLDFAKLGKFRQFGNPAKNRILGSMVDAGMVMRGLDMPTAMASGSMGPAKATRELARPVSWLVSTKKIAEWLTNPEDSAMFMALLQNKPLKAKPREWFRNQTARAIAAASMNEDPDIKPIPTSVSRQDYAPATGREPRPQSYGGIRG